MWREGKKILLKQALNSLTRWEQLDWVINRLSGAGGGGLGLSFIELEALIANSPDGVRVTSDALKEIADGLRDLDSLELTGYAEGRSVAKLECLDSSWWIIEYEPSAVDVKPFQMTRPGE